VKRVISMIHSIYIQVKNILHQKITIAVFGILMLLVFLNFLSNVFTYRGHDIVDMIHPMKLLLLSYNKVYDNADPILNLTQLYPILVVGSTGFTLQQERSLKMSVYCVSRTGKKNYILSKIIASFVATTIVFTVPFLIEIALNCVSFPLSATGDLSYWSIYNANYLSSVSKYMFSSVFQYSAYLYAVMGTILFGLFSGVLAMFTTAISALIQFRFRIVLFFPVYLLLNATIYLEEFVKRYGLNIHWYDYVLLFDDEKKNPAFFYAAVAVLLLLVVVFSAISCRADEL
jgi:hypothetical protein